MKKRLLVVATIFFMAGCTSVSTVDAKKDAALKTFVAPADKAGVYIYRNESFGFSTKIDVEVDGKLIGQTTAKTYLYKELTPGKHSISAKAGNTDTIEIDVKSGTLSYIKQEVKTGAPYARSKLHPVGEAEGKKGVLETRLAETK